MLEDKARVRLSYYNFFTEVWVVDGPAMFNYWNQDGLHVPTICRGKGDAKLPGSGGEPVYLYDDANFIIALDGMPVPGRCKRGMTGKGIAMKDSGIGHGYSEIGWEVLEIE